MPETRGSTSPSGNELLAALSRHTFERVATRLQPVPLEHGHVLLQAGEPIDAAYFPDSGVVSLLSPLDEDGGHGIEVGMAGREGMVGVPLVLGQTSALTRAEIQLPGHGWRISAPALRQEIDSSTEFRTVLLRFVCDFHNQVSQTAACNGRHSIFERLSRWLLMSHDRWDSDELPLTHEYLSSMLGVRRAGVTVALGGLQKAGLILHRNGSIRIVDRAGLEQAACECYAMVKQADAAAPEPPWRSQAS